jgi:hypothetical protein
MKCTRVVGTSFTKLGLFFYKVFFIIGTLFFFFRVCVRHAVCVNLSSETLQVLAQVFFFFSLPIKRRNQLMSKLTSLASLPFTILRLEPSLVTNSVTTLCLVRSPQHPPFCTASFVTARGVTGARMITGAARQCRRPVGNARNSALRPAFVHAVVSVNRVVWLVGY